MVVFSQIKTHSFMQKKLTKVLKLKKVQHNDFVRFRECHHQIPQVFFCKHGKFHFLSIFSSNAKHFFVKHVAKTCGPWAKYQPEVLVNESPTFHIFPTFPIILTKTSIHLQQNWNFLWNICFAVTAQIYLVKNWIGSIFLGCERLKNAISRISVGCRDLIGCLVFKWFGCSQKLGYHF